MPPPSSSSSRSFDLRTLFLSLLLGLSALAGVVFVRPYIRFPLLPPPPPSDKDKKASSKGSNASPARNDIRIKDVEEKEYEELGAKAVDAFKAGNYAEALAGFTQALAIGEGMTGVATQQKTLLSNRSACYERYVFSPPPTHPTHQHIHPLAPSVSVCLLTRLTHPPTHPPTHSPKKQPGAICRRPGRLCHHPQNGPQKRQNPQPTGTHLDRLG